MAATLADMDANAANYLLGALNQNAQADVVFEQDRSTVAQSLINAVDQLNREVKRISQDVERLRRDAAVMRRRSL